MSHRLFTLFIASIFVGCAATKSAAPNAVPDTVGPAAVASPAAPRAEQLRPPQITIRYPNEFWVVLPPEQTPPGSAQYAINRITGAEIDIRMLPAVPAEFIKVAAARMKKNGAQLSEIAVSADGTAASVSFTIADAKQPTRGKLTATAIKGLPPGAAIVFFGLWSVEFDKSMLADFNAIAGGTLIQ